MSRLWITITTVCILLTGCNQQKIIIQNGKANATIVIPQKTDNLTEKTAVDLQNILNKMTGVTLPIRSDNEKITGNRILVGQTKWTDTVVSKKERDSLGEEGFIIRRKGKAIALTGGGPYGTAYAASELMEMLGARWYMPGPIGEVIPKLNVVKFEKRNVRQVPSFKMRWVGNDLQWNLRNKTNNIKDDSLPPAYQIKPGVYHTQERLIPHSIYFEKNPEFFALIDGKRCPDLDCKLCNSNPQLPKEIAKRMAQVIQTNPGIDMISLSPTDHQKWCECENCKALDEPNVPKDQKYSRRQMVLYNRVAEELEKDFPDMLILVGAYNVYNWPPKDPNIKGHPNLAVVICHYNDYCLAHPVNDPNCKPNTRYRELIKAWRRHTSHICFYEYYDKVLWLDFPWPIVHSIAKDIPYFKELDLEGLYTQYSTKNIWSNFLNFYVASKLLWDHTTDVNALLEDFYVKFYGKASEPMKKYHELLENQLATCKAHTAGNYGYAAARIFTPQILKKMSEYYQQATGLAEDNLVKARLERIGCSIEYTKRLAQFFHLRISARMTKGAKKIQRYEKALNHAIAMRDDVLNNHKKYKGVASGRYFIKEKYAFGREIKRTEKELAEAKAQIKK